MSALSAVQEIPLTLFIVLVGMPFFFETVALTNDYYVHFSCSECGFYGEIGIGCESDNLIRLFQSFLK